MYITHTHTHTHTHTLHDAIVGIASLGALSARSKAKTKTRGAYYK